MARPRQQVRAVRLRRPGGGRSGVVCRFLARPADPFRDNADCLAFGPGALCAVFSGGLYLFALGLLALRLGFVIRHTAVAISTFVGLMFVLRVISDLLPSSLSADLGRFLPQNIGTVMFTVQYHGTDPQDW